MAPRCQWPTQSMAWAVSDSRRDVGGINLPVITTSNPSPTSPLSRAALAAVRQARAAISPAIRAREGKMANAPASILRAVAARAATAESRALASSKKAAQPPGGRNFFRILSRITYMRLSLRP